MYGKVINGKIVYAPDNYKRPDGTLIIGFNTNEELMQQYGYKEIVEHNTDYDPVTEELYITNIQESTTVIDVYYSARNKVTYIDVNLGDSYSRDETYDKKSIDKMINDLKSSIADLKFNHDDIQVMIEDTVKKGDLLNEPSLIKRSEFIQSLESFRTTISEQHVDQNGLNEKMSAVEQKADKISWLVKSGTSESDMELTDKAFDLISKNIKLTADRINLNGYVSNEDSNWGIDLNGNIFSKNMNVEGELSTDTVSCNKISNPKYPEALSSNINIYINSSGNDDVELDNNAKFQTLKGALNSIPLFLNGKTVNITLENNITENITIKGFHSGIINIFLNGKTVFGWIKGSMCSANIRIYGGTKNNKEGQIGIIHPKVSLSFSDRNVSMGFESCFFVGLYNLKIFGGDTKVSGLDGDKVCIDSQMGSQIYCRTISIVNTDIGFRSHACSNIYVNSSSGVASKYAFQGANGGIVSIGNGAQSSGTIGSTNKYSGGSVFSDAPSYASGDTSTSTDVAETESTVKTVTYTSTSADTYRSSVYNSWKKDNIARQGDYGYGDCNGCWFFDNQFEDLEGKTINKVTIKINRQSGGSSSEVRLAVKTHNYTKRPSGAPNLNLSCGTLSLSTNSSGTLTITNSDVLNSISNGTVKGFGIKSTYDKAHYAVCSGAVTVKITYTE